jgi:hypothetical protein
VLGALGRAVFIRSGSVGSRRRTPDLLFIAAVIAWGGVLVGASNRGERRTDRENARQIDAVEACDQDAAAVLDEAPMPRGMSMRRAPRAEAKAILSSIPAEIREQLEFRLVLEKGERAGVAFALPGGDVEEIAAGMVEPAERRGDRAERRTAELAGTQVQEAQWTRGRKDVYALLGRYGCVAVWTLGLDERPVRSVVEALINGPP